MVSLSSALDALAELGPQGIARFQAFLDVEWIECSVKRLVVSAGTTAATAFADTACDGDFGLR